jgi:hypothetical protein
MMYWTTCVRSSVEGDWPVGVGSDRATAGFLLSKVVPPFLKVEQKTQTALLSAGVLRAAELFLNPLVTIARYRYYVKRQSLQRNVLPLWWDVIRNQIDRRVNRQQ